MNLLSSDIEKIISSYEDTIVAQVTNNNDVFDSSSVIIKYQNTDYPSAALDSVWESEYRIIQSINSDGVLTAYTLKKNKKSYVLFLENFSSVTLASFIEHNTLNFSQCLYIANQLGLVLADVHRHQFIHRNINPSNILIDPDSLKIKLFNFSNATDFSDTKVELHKNDLQGCCYEYISPEQTGRINLKVDYRSDFYSLGVTLYQLFSGRLPFSSDTTITLLHCHIARTPDSLMSVNEKIPEAISSIVAKLMAKSPEHRYQSAYGLQKDLEHCYQQWQKNKKIAAFTLAELDVPLYFNISPKIYGREAELDIIFQAYQRSCNKKNELTMISGYSGVGKSALVRELQSHIVVSNGLLISGKCDQYNRNQPFSVLIEALQQLLQKILSGNKESQFNWRNKLQLILGNNAGIITELLPTLALIISTPSTLSILPSVEAELRLNMVFTDFVNALYSSEQPLVILLDDLQWIDIPTLKLLQQVGENSQTGLYIIGVYRDNEVDASHPLTKALTVIEQQGAISKIHLKPLKVKHVQHLLSDTLHTGYDDVAVLTELCVNKTQGNPFFLKQFLLALYQEGDISYNHVEGQWLWNTERIQQRDMTDNVVDLMISRLKLLDKETQLLASIAAHLGHQFSFKQLLSSCQYSVETTKDILRPLLEAGFILATDEYYQYVDDESHLSLARYQFLHDKVQQAAYMLTPEEGREQLLLHIGRRWLADSSANEIELNLFTLVNLLNGAIKIIGDVDELTQLATLNYRAGVKSKKAATYDDAVNYLRIAKDLLGYDIWKSDPGQTLDIYKALIDVEFLAGNVVFAKSLYEQSVEDVPTKADKVSLILLRAEQCQSHGQYHEGIELLMYALDTLNIEFPQNEKCASAQLTNTFNRTQKLRAQYTDEQILTADKVVDSTVLLRMEIHNALATAFYLCGRVKSYAVNGCTMVELSLNYGQSELSSIGYASYATVMSMMGEKYPACYNMSKLAKSVSDVWDSKYHRAIIYQYFSSSYQHWCEPIDNTYVFQEQVITWGQEGINFLYSGYSVLFKVCNKLIAGVQLNDLRVDIERDLNFLKKKQQYASINFVLLGAYQSILALQEETDSPSSFDDSSFSVTEYFNGDFTTPSMDLAFYTCAIARHAFLMNDKTLQQQCLSNIDIVAMFLPDSPIMTESIFYQALIIFDDDNRSEDNLVRAIEICDEFGVWSLDSPDNYRHKYLLLSAEIARIKNDTVAAINFYAQAISEANKAKYINNEALSSERYAIYLLALDQNRLAYSCIKEAYYLYLRWGAKAKCALLDKQWPQKTFTVINMEVQPDSDFNNINNHRSTKDISVVDLHSLLRANQLLSEEIHVNSLLERMMSVLMENAGAQQGAIIVYDEGQLTLEVVGRINHGASCIDSQFYNMNLDDIEAQSKPLLPDTLIRYTQKTMKTLILNNASEDIRFLDNAYLRLKKPKSLMCFPILEQGHLVAIVYLENNMIEKAFTTRHRDTVEFIAAQAAISLMNARHYESLEDKVAQRTEELQQLAIKDGLTGIFNRREFDNRLSSEWSRSSRESSSLTLIMIDIDHFKSYNDNYGHPEGDKCIKLVAETLSNSMTRKNDLVARYGGEEFVILMTNTDHEAVELIARRCQDRIKALNINHEFSSTEDQDRITISMGICTMKSLPGLDSAMLVKSADVALYKAKQNGRNQYYFASPF